jgi:hypothetical protein
MYPAQFIASNENVLFHAVKAEYALEQLTNGFIEGHTHQRYWADGLRRKDNHPNYEDSYILKGLSTTRDIEYAKRWGQVIYVLDKEKIRNQFKITPYSWGYSIPDSTTPGMGKTLFHKFCHKREREEFIILGKIEKSFNQLKQEWEELYNGENEPDVFINQNDYVFQKLGKMQLNEVLKGIIIVTDNDVYNNYKKKEIEAIKEHPKFIGTISKEKRGMQIR